jgi:hypothetical protein
VEYVSKHTESYVKDDRAMFFCRTVALVETVAEEIVGITAYHASQPEYLAHPRNN